MIGIIEYGMGNLRSVQKAFEHVGAQAIILSSPNHADAIDKLVLPGVGAFRDGMEHLRRAHWPDFIRDFIASGRPFLGICLGMQLLFDSSQEDAPSPGQPVPGLAILPGQVVRFQPRPNPTGRPLKIPHMGWNTLAWSRPDPLLAGLSQGASVYFVHSYYPLPDSPPGSADSPVSATADYGVNFCASIWKDNIWATQFHPEKSQKTGLTMLENFAQND